MSEQTGKIVVKSIMWIAVGAISIIAMLTNQRETSTIIVGTALFAALVSVQS